MKKQTMNDIKTGQLFICPGVGVLRKIHPCQGQTKDGKTHVIYPMEGVRLLAVSRKEKAHV